MTANEILDLRFRFEDTFGRRPNERLLLVFWNYQEARKVERQLYEQTGGLPHHQEGTVIYGCLLWYFNPKNIEEKKWGELPLLRADEKFNPNLHKGKVLHTVSCTNSPCLVRREGDICKGITIEGYLVCFEAKRTREEFEMQANFHILRENIDINQLKDVIDKFRKQRQEKEQEEKKRANRWGVMSGTKITGKQFRELVNETGIDVEILTSNFIEDGKGYLLRRKDATVLQVNQATLALIRQAKDNVETLDNLQLTILPFDLGIDWS